MADANVYDSAVMMSVATYLNDLEDPDELEAEGYEVTPEALLNPNIKDEEKVKLYRKKKFHEFLKDYLRQQFKKDKAKLSHAYCEKVYRNMYEKNVEPNPQVSYFMKVMYHPDCTIGDHTYIREKISKFTRNIIITQAGLFTGLIYTYYKTSYGQRLRNNPAMAMLVLGTTPALGYLVQNYGNQYLLNRRISNMGLLDKYNIKH